MLVTFVFAGFYACSDDDDDDNFVNGLEDIDVVIDANQTFNMVNFAISFEQLFGSDARWYWDYDHDIVSGKAVTTYQNIKVHGKFGDKAFTIVHSFNSNDVITSSTRRSSEYYDDEEMIFTYTYDNEGMIIQLTKEKNGSIRDVVDIEYNAAKQLVKKIHRGDYNYNDGDEEIFTYNSDGTVNSYFNENWDYEYVYTYENGNMVKEQEYYEGSPDDTDIFVYDSSGRLISEYEEGYQNQWREDYVYYDDHMSEIDYYDNIIDDITDYIEGLIRIKRWDFEYDNNVFEFCTTKEYYYVEGYDDSLVSKKEYFEGTPENLVLVGYVTVDSRDPANNYKKTKESIYDANDNLLYYVTYVVSNNSIQSHQVYETDGTPIDDHDMDQLMWMEELISSLNIT